MESQTKVVLAIFHHITFLFSYISISWNYIVSLLTYRKVPGYSKCLPYVCNKIINCRYCFNLYSLNYSIKSFNRIKNKAILWRNCPVRHPNKTIKELRKNWNIDLSLIQQLHFWSYTPKNECRDLNRYLHTDNQSNVIYNIKRWKTTQMFINTWTGKQKLYIYIIEYSSALKGSGILTHTTKKML